MFLWGYDCGHQILLSLPGIKYFSGTPKVLKVIESDNEMLVLRKFQHCFYIKDYVNLDFFIGAKKRSDIYEAFENIYPILKGFKKA